MSPKGPQPPMIKLTDVSASFRSDSDVLQVLGGLSLDVGRGEFVSILGPSGCGKSTLLSLLAGTGAADAGSVLVGGQAPVAGRSSGAPRSAWMPQRDLLFPWRTVLDNVALAGQIAQGLDKTAARSEASELLERFGIGDFASARPDELSGGMRQRAALARTVAQGRDILLLDEPFGGLDAITRTELQLWLEEIWERERWTVVLVTHDVREAALLSDRVHVLSPRPASLVRTVEVSIERPRTLATITDTRLALVEQELLSALGVGQGRGTTISTAEK